MDADGYLFDSGTQGFVVSFVTGEAVFHAPYRPEWYRWVEPAHDLRHYGSEVLA